MLTTQTTGAATPADADSDAGLVPRLPTLRASHAPADSLCIRLRLRQSDRKQIERLKLKVEAIAGSRPSTSVLLRAALLAMDACADAVATETKKAGEVRSRRELSFLWWVASAAKAIGG